MPDKLVITQTVAPIYNEPSFTAQMVTQGLLWESLVVKDKNQQWYQIQMEDGYSGWIHEFYSGKAESFKNNSIQITNRYAPVRRTRGRDSAVTQLLSFGTRLPAEKPISGYSLIILPNGEEGFVPPQALVATLTRESLIQIAETLKGVPYLWGGKSSFGYDCSGFLQAVISHFGIQFYRDTRDQIKDERLIQIDGDKIEKGDLIYFFEDGIVNHTAISLNDKEYIHCSGCVRVQSNNKSDSHYNPVLDGMDRKYYSIKNFLNR